MVNITHYRAYSGDGKLITEGNCEADGSASFSSEKVVDRVVFYSGDAETEVVAGSKQVSSSGPINAMID